VSQDPEQYQEDEISISALIMKLWQRRGLIVALPLVFAGAALVLLLARGSTAEVPMVYYVSLSSIQGGQYPGGATFQPSDLLAPEVLDVLSEQFDVQDRQQLRDALSVDYGSPMIEGLLVDYRSELAQKNLNPADVAQINERYQSKRNAIQQGGLRLAIDFVALGMSQEQAITVAQTWPRAWNHLYSNKYQMSAQNNLSGAVISRAVKSLASTSAILDSRNLLNTISKGAAVISADGRWRGLRTEAGYSAADLQSELGRFRVLYFTPIFTSLFSNPDQSSASFLHETELSIDELTRNIDNFDQVIGDIRSFQAVEGSQAQGSRQGLSNEMSGGIQFTESSLQQVLGLSQKASLSEYLKATLDKRTALALARSALITELARPEPNNIVIEGAFLQIAENELTMLSDNYIELLGIVNKRANQVVGQFYSAFDGPAVNQSRLPGNAILVLVLGIVLGGLVAVVLALLLPIRGREIP